MQVAVLGLGSIGMRHARNLAALGCTVIGFDPDAGRRAQLEKDGGKTVAARDDALAASQSAVIASPGQFHREDLAAAIRAGRSTLVEKPFVLATEGVAELLDEAHRKALVVAVAHNLRFHAAVRHARALIDDGRIGDLIWASFTCGSYLPAWRPGQNYTRGYAADPSTGGVMFDIVHEFDVAAFLLGSMKTERAIARRTGLLDMPSEDCADIWMRSQNGAIVSLHLDYVSRPPVRTSIIVGTDGRIEMDLLARTVRYRPANGADSSIETFNGSFDDDYRIEADDFLRNIKDGTPPACSGREALAVMIEVIAARRMAGLPDAS